MVGTHESYWCGLLFCEFFLKERVCIGKRDERTSKVYVPCFIFYLLEIIQRSSIQFINSNVAIQNILHRINDNICNQNLLGSLWKFISILVTYFLVDCDYLCNRTLPYLHLGFILMVNNRFQSFCLIGVDCLLMSYIKCF